MSDGTAAGDNSDFFARFEDEGLFARDIDGQLVRMDKVTSDDLDKNITIKIDGQSVTVRKAVPATDAQGNIRRDREGRPVPRATTIYDAAAELFVKQPGDQNPIPILCHQEHMEPVAVCRICVVEIHKFKRGKIDRERKLLPACQHRVEETMEVHTIESPDAEARARVRSSVSVLAELLRSDHLPTGKEHAPFNELAALCERLNVQSSRFSSSTVERGRDDSSFVIAVDHNACILCDRCARACDDVKKNLVIGRAGKGYTTKIAFDLNDPMGQSSCVSCGECMVSCPTGALVFRETSKDPRVGEQFSVTMAETSTVSADELKRDPLFAGLPYKFLQWNSSSIRRHRLQPGAVLCREGEAGSTAFILLKGQFEVSIRAALKGIRNEKAEGWRGWFGRIRTSLLPGGDSAGDTIHNADGLSLPLGKPVKTLTPEDVLLGEMTCLNHYPRSATVVAKEPGEVLEIGRNVLHYLRRNRYSREILDTAYRERALMDHLKRSKLLASLDEDQRTECANFLRDKVDLLRADPGQVIFRQGDVADHFYMVRLGFVRVLQTYAGQERVLDYLGPGSSLGEIGLLSELAVQAAAFGIEHHVRIFETVHDGAGDRWSDENEEGVVAGVARSVRTATCQALDEVELVRIRGEHFRELLNRFPGIRAQLLKHARELLDRDRRTHQSLAKPLADFLDQGLFNAQKLLVLDLESCTRCDECTRACSDTHGGITRLIREGMRFDRFLVASSCRSCLDPYCLVGCPVDAIHRRQRPGSDTSLEIVIEDWCIGCGQCAKNCPYGNINMHGIADYRPDPENPGQRVAVLQQKATTCDLCRHVVGADEDPSCVYACPHNAAFRMSGPDLFQIVTGTKQ